MIKKALLLGALGVISLNGFAQKRSKKNKDKEQTVVPVAPLLQTKIDTVSYGIGQDIGNTLKTQGLDSLNLNVLRHAIEDALKDTTLVAKEIANMSISNYLQQIKAEKMQKNKEAGEKFLAENKTKPGVVALPSGLQYQILKEGNGPKPTAADKVKTHYHGTLIDGTVFDSSVERGQPISFPVGGVIKGWTEALQLMPVGSKWRLFIPADLAYGERQAGPKIGPNSALIFDVELLDIEK
ncbi:MAG: peptidylprolyl isomerase FKBP-type [Bacteroidetes bacterium]|uniref:FKBP-type peptidyl-prolyl cis-trans isomerase n=1 Tax=Chitinophaga TaxID=79328 RepID=UPI0009CF23E2|nr:MULTISPECIES: FKBP-type peptidyl-prolyl cis-trans isomerase [Chitinophaga]MBP1650061.1 peptidylprolyl isomerase FKBP-type [Bacteroidota bacterium]OMP80981.1 peptidylprolyl isomerase [[Flexibacter] sp. ATCC 35208]WPQ65393.1 FKBP-type peptidyl-prolyl cis-trans isomerase [Chitinophaga sancti]WPV69869.1 FKBP-type peptidyl-prolyl cis-trans isomerase [Chitinophaga sp. LS1]